MNFETKEAAIDYLTTQGFRVSLDGFITHPFDRSPEPNEQDAIQYLCREHGMEYEGPENDL